MLTTEGRDEMQPTTGKGGAPRRRWPLIRSACCARRNRGRELRMLCMARCVAYGAVGSWCAWRIVLRDAQWRGVAHGGAVLRMAWGVG